MFKRLFFIVILCMSIVIMQLPGDAEAGRSKSSGGWGFNETFSLFKVLMQGEGECDQDKPFGDCGLEVAAIGPIFNSNTGLEDVEEGGLDCKKFAPMEMVNEDPATWFAAPSEADGECVAPVRVGEDNPNKKKRNPDVTHDDPNFFKWSDLSFLESTDDQFSCDNNGICWVFQVFTFADLLGKTKKNWEQHAVLDTALVFNITYERGFVCGVLENGDVNPIGVLPAPNNIECCEAGPTGDLYRYIDDATDGCVEGRETFSKVACEDTTRNITDPFSLEQPGCTPKEGTFQNWGASQGGTSAYAPYIGLPDVLLQRIELPSDFEFGDQGSYPHAVCSDHDDNHVDGFTETYWDCPLPEL